MMVMTMVVVVMVVKMCIRGAQNLYWSCSLIHTLKTTEFLVGNSRPSSCPAYTVDYFCLPTTALNEMYMILS